MGKGKRTNPGVGVDFRKVKHKVGKKLPKAQNDTRTDFKSRSINLPNQSVGQDKAGAAVSERNLTLKELVGQLSHHNTHTRRDALTGLQQLLLAHPAEARRNTATLLEALAPCISDGEASVRGALLALLRTAALPALGSVAMTPFLPMFMAHLSAALTNMSADVRLDALAVLQALTEACPQLMARAQQLHACIAHYSGLLSRANRGTSVKSQALAGLMRVLASLERFLTAALTAAATAATDPVAVDQRQQVPASACCNSTGPLFGSRADPAPATALLLPTPAELLKFYTNSSIGSSSNIQQQHTQQQQQQQQQQREDQPATASEGASPAAQLQQQVLELLSVLFDCWAEAAPSSLSATPEAESAQVLVCILTCSQLLIDHLDPLKSTAAKARAGPALAAGATATRLMTGLVVGITDNVLGINAKMRDTSNITRCPGFSINHNRMMWARQAAGIVLPKLLPVFPVSAPAAHASEQLQELLQRFNLVAVQLLTGFMAAGVTWQPKRFSTGVTSGMRGGGAAGMAVVQHQQPVEWHERLLAFMAEVLRNGSCLPSNAFSAIQQPTQAAAAATDSTATGPNTPDSTKQPAAKRLKQQQRQGPDKQYAAMPAAGISSGGGGGSTSVLTVLKCLQVLLPQLPTLPGKQLLSAVRQLVASASAASAATAAVAAAGTGAALTMIGSAGNGTSAAVVLACTQLQLQLMLRYLVDLAPDPAQEYDIAAWLAAAPKTLWGLGTSNPGLCGLLVSAVYQAARLSLPGSLVQQQLGQMQPHLAALFAAVLPAGARRPTKRRKHQDRQRQQQQQQDQTAPAAPPSATQLLVGPLSGLPAQTQALAIDTLRFLPHLQQPLLKAVAICCRLCAYSNSTVQRLLDAVLSGASSSTGPDVYLSFTATLLSQYPVGGYVDRASGESITAGFPRHQLVVDAVCRWLHNYGPLADLLQLLAPLLVQQWWQQHDLLQQQQPQQDNGATMPTLMASYRDSTAIIQIRCVSYSCTCVAALAAGCWKPSSSSGRFGLNPSSTDSSRSGTIGAGDAATAQLIPTLLADTLTKILVAYCTSSIVHEAGATIAANAISEADKAATAAAATVTAASASDKSAGDASTVPVHFTAASAAEVTSAGQDKAINAVDGCLLSVLPLLAAQPKLLMPFLQEMVFSCVGFAVRAAAAATNEMSAAVDVSLGSRRASSSSKVAGLLVAAHTIDQVLGQQVFKGHLLQHKQHLQQAVQQLVGFAKHLQEVGVPAHAVASVQQLQTAVTML